MSRYHESLREMVDAAERFAAAVRKAAHAANGADSSEADAAAQVAVMKCRNALLETLNDVPAMRIIYSVTPLR